MNKRNELLEMLYELEQKKHSNDSLINDLKIEMHSNKNNIYNLYYEMIYLKEIASRIEKNNITPRSNKVSLIIKMLLPFVFSNLYAFLLLKFTNTMNIISSSQFYTLMNSAALILTPISTYFGLKSYVRNNELLKYDLDVVLKDIEQREELYNFYLSKFDAINKKIEELYKEQGEIKMQIQTVMNKLSKCYDNNKLNNETSNSLSTSMELQENIELCDSGIQKVKKL